ncbi:DUF5683 domain-containing protein [Mangrovimonas aestuarii]|uniref:DUF5683 domain-containing protein n=1 Tax=Mangrovimonas aestuarii TaxID=3018443 RepID=UPI002378CF45|nr:DUF5683 domain-containing protein [Mangrovimonas aestuarii]
MQNKGIILVFFFLGISLTALAQDKKKEDLPKAKPTTSDSLYVDTKATIRKPIDPLSPARAAFYSAVLPGLGQAYNKKYWKIPIVYAALGGSIYAYTYNNDNYNRARDAYKRRLGGYTDDEFYGRISDEGLRNAQKEFRRNRDLWLLVSIGVYALNIIDANVDAHLLQYNVDENLSLAPHFKLDEKDASSNLGLTLNFKF